MWVAERITRERVQSTAASRKASRFQVGLGSSHRVGPGTIPVWGHGEGSRLLWRLGFRLVWYLVCRLMGKCLALGLVPRPPLAAFFHSYGKQIAFFPTAAKKAVRGGWRSL